MTNEQLQAKIIKHISGVNGPDKKLVFSGTMDSILNVVDDFIMENVEVTEHGIIFKFPADFKVAFDND